jgi:chromosome partitioning protein
LTNQEQQSKLGHMLVISIVNNKGGVAKTTTCHNLGVAIALKGYKVGLIDLDAQGNLSYVVEHYKEPSQNYPQGVDLEDLLPTPQNPQAPNLDYSDFSKTNIPNLRILPNRHQISSSSFEGLSPIQKVKFMQSLMTELGQSQNQPDMVIIDTPPDLDIEVFSAMSASDWVVVVIDYSPFALLGIKKLLDNLEDIVQSGINPKLKIAGLLPTKVDLRRSLNTEIQVSLEQVFKDVLLKSLIRVNSRFEQAQSDRKSIFEYGDIKGMQDYNEVADELLEKFGLEKKVKPMVARL